MDLDAINQIILDKLSPHPVGRWAAFAALLLLYILKIMLTGTHHLISYCVGVYLLHGFILFATPKDESIPDPFEMDEEGEGEVEEYSPTNIDNSFRPFVRNLPEYSYWLFCMKVLLCCHILTLISFTDIPVCTPILVMYFIFMVATTVVMLWQHARRYKYNPFWQSKAGVKE